MRQILIISAMLALLITPVSASADEDHVQGLDAGVSTQLADHDGSGSDLPAPDRGAEHCGHCVSMSLRPESLTVVQTGGQISTHLRLVNVPRMILVARAKKPPRS